MILNLVTGVLLSSRARAGQSSVWLHCPIIHPASKVGFAAVFQRCYHDWQQSKIALPSILLFKTKIDIWIVERHYKIVILAALLMQE